MYDVIDAVEANAENKPRYLMGVGTPENIKEGVYRGVDFSTALCRPGTGVTDICSRGRAS
jgi:tRNA-guanine family transglycosylase